VNKEVLHSLVSGDLTFKRVIMRAVKKVFPRVWLRSSDIILAAFPKSGSTWVRFIIANIISLAELNGKAVDYNLLNGGLCATYDSDLYGAIRYCTLPRFVKTHMIYEKRRFGGHRILYVYRNPGDTMVSFFEYRRNLRGYAKFKGDFSRFIRHEEFGLEAWCRHVKSWIDNADVVVTYEDLKKNTLNVLKDALASLRVGCIPEDILREAVSRSSFEAVRNMEEQKGLDERAERQLEPTFRFARKGTIGQWKEYFKGEDCEFLYTVLREHGVEDLYGFSR